VIGALLVSVDLLALRRPPTRRARDDDFIGQMHGRAMATDHEACLFATDNCRFRERVVAPDDEPSSSVLVTALFEWGDLRRFPLARCLQGSCSFTSPS
jgi:hypothetical protein